MSHARHQENNSKRIKLNSYSFFPPICTCCLLRISLAGLELVGSPPASAPANLYMGVYHYIGLLFVDAALFFFFVVQDGFSFAMYLRMILNF